MQKTSKNSNRKRVLLNLNRGKVNLHPIYNSLLDFKNFKFNFSTFHQGTSHCVDQNEYEPGDSDELLYVRETIGDLISKWVQEATTTTTTTTKTTKITTTPNTVTSSTTTPGTTTTRSTTTTSTSSTPISTDTTTKATAGSKAISYSLFSIVLCFIIQN